MIIPHNLALLTEEKEKEKERNVREWEVENERGYERGEKA